MIQRRWRCAWRKSSTPTRHSRPSSLSLVRSLANERSSESPLFRPVVADIAVWLFPPLRRRRGGNDGGCARAPRGGGSDRASIAMAAIPALRLFDNARPWGEHIAYYVLVCSSCINARTSAINNAADHRTVINRAAPLVWSECAARSSVTSGPSARMLQIYRRSLQEDVNHSATCCLSRS